MGLPGDNTFFWDLPVFVMEKISCYGDKQLQAGDNDMMSML